MSLISLITDFGLKDNFVGIMKAVILKINPQAQIVDICHEVKPQGLLEAAFLLRGSFRYFPKGSVHLVVVDPGVGSQRKKIIAKTKNYYFIGPDNGVLALALKDEPPIDIVEITSQRYFLKPTSDTFHGRDIFAPISAYLSRTLDKVRDLSKGAPLRKFGRRIKSIQELSTPSVKVSSKVLTGEIIYIDRFGNLVSNIDKDTLENFVSATKRGGSASATRIGGCANICGANLFGGKNKKFKIFIKDKTIDRLFSSYAEGKHLKPLALIDSFNHLEIALNCGSACDYLKAKKGTKVFVYL
jgi:hypothetical protein